MATRQKIIEVASQLFAEKGYEGMTMKEIAKAVGIKAPSLYAFFESKEQIFLEIYQSVIADHLNLAEPSPEASELMVKEQLEHMLRRVMEYQLKESLRIKIYMRLLLFPPDVFPRNLKQELLKMEEEEYAWFCQLFQRGMDQGEIKEGDCGAIAVSLLCMMDGLFWEMQRLDEATFWERFRITWNQFWQGIQKE